MVRQFTSDGQLGHHSCMMRVSLQLMYSSLTAAKWAPGRASAQGDPWAISFVTEDLLEKKLRSTKRLEYFFLLLLCYLKHSSSNTRLLISALWYAPSSWSLQPSTYFIPWLFTSWMFLNTANLKHYEQRD